MSEYTIIRTFLQCIHKGKVQCSQECSLCGSHMLVVEDGRPIYRYYDRGIHVYQFYRDTWTAFSSNLVGNLEYLYV